MGSLDPGFQISENLIHVLSYRPDFQDLYNLVLFSVEISKPGSIEPKNEILHELIII